MSVEYAIVGLIAAALLCYLCYSLLRPEKL
jgi:K+-transporting ATPase KdpF subunit